MPKVKIVRNQEIAEIPIKQAGEARVATPFLRRVTSENIREEELGATKTKLTVSNITFSQTLSLVDNGQVTSRMNITVTNAKKITPLNFLTDIYTINKEDGYVINSQDHDFRLTTTQRKHEYWYTMGKLVNLEFFPNSIDVVTQFTNISGATQDYFFEYRLLFMK